MGSGFIDDVRRAWREAARRSWATAGAAAMLAVGIGLTTALFGAIDAVLLRPLPLQAPERVIVAWTHDVTRGYAHFPITHRAYDVISANATRLATFAAVDAHGTSEVPVADVGGARSVHQARVLGDFFGTLGVRPLLGRLTSPADAVPGEAGSAVLSHGFWQRAFGGEGDVLGRVVRAGERSLTIVGVAPPGFDYPRGAELWTPMRPIEDARPQLELDLVARLAPGATREQAEAEIGRLLRSDEILTRTYADGTIPVTRTLRGHLLGDVRPILIVLLAGAALVLVVAIANVANLLLVQGAGRASQFAIRLALGADLRRLMRQLLAEGVVLGGTAAAAGLAVAWVALRLLVPLAPGAPGLDAAALDLRALAFAATLTILVTLACAVVPGIAASRLTPATVLSGGLRIAGGRPGRGLSRRALGAVQIALAVAALAGAHLLVRSFVQLRALDPGFDPVSLHLVELSVPYPVFEVPGAYLDALGAVGERLEARADVTGATPVLSAPLLASGGYAAPVLLEGQANITEARDNPLLSIDVVLPDYFATLSTGVRRGRGFEATDRAGAPPVVVINETTARLLWPGEEALGQRVRLPFPGITEVEWTVAGVVEDTRWAALLEPRPMLYLPLLQFRAFAPPFLAVRTTGGGVRNLAAATQAAFDALDPRVRVLGVSSVAATLDEPLAGPRFAAVVLALFALAAVVLAAAGVYAVLAAAVRERTREFGIRIALGARLADVWRLVLAHGLAIAAVGVPAGLLLALAAARRVESLLFGVAAADPVALGAAVLAILVVALLACAAPAIRAGRVDPARTLRVE